MLTIFANHVWQSTIFAVLAALLAVALRKEQARVRYWVWLIASIKFLIPLSWLVFIGNQLAGSSGLEVSGHHRFYMTIQVIAGASPSSVPHAFIRWIPAIWVVWTCGTAGVTCSWCIRWIKLLRARQTARTLRAGREIEALRRAEHRAGSSPTTEIVSSKASVELGVFGIVRPVLMWPEGISERLSDNEMDAILAHEVRHLQRRDNLAAAVHMAVEAIFWFHPLVWWIGERLVEERERACDEDVLALGNQPQAYAEGILKVCEFCLMSPVACMSGVAGGNLKQRMVSIMTNRGLKQLSSVKKALLAIVGVASVLGPVAVGLVHASDVGTETRSRNLVIASGEREDSHASAQASKKEMEGLIVKKVNPVYPEAARKAHIQGQVLLRATIGKQGDVEKLDVVSGPPELAPAAVEAVKQWKYRPYKKGGHPVDVVTDITVNFSLAE